MASTSAPPWLHGTGRGAKDGRSPIRGQDRTAVPAPSSATHHHRAAAQRCGPQHAQGDDTTAPPHHRTTAPRCQRDRPAQDNSAAQGTLSHRAHPSGAPTTTTTAVHGRRAGRARQGDQPGRPPGTCHRHPPAPPGTRQLDRRAPCINMQSNGQAAQLGHRFGFWNATALLTARSSPFPRENHFKPAGTGQERAKTQVSVHKGGVS